MRDVSFYRRPRTIFKGFRVPDWAQNQNKYGWDVDAYSRQAWNNAMLDLEAEWTPKQFAGERQEPNPLQWFRMENWRGGFKDRLFYNEVPQMSWRRQRGHVLDADTESERDRVLYSFTQANQDQHIMFGMDTRTPEGAAAFKAEYETLCELAPEIIKKEDMIMPHEMAPKISEEPHFQRVWQHYREHAFKVRFAEAVDEGRISEDDARMFNNFVGMTNHPSFGIFALAKAGKLAHMERDESFQASMRVLDAMNLGDIEIEQTTAMPPEEQFWQQIDGFLQLTEKDMRKQMPYFITDKANQAKVEALLSENEETATHAAELPSEATRSLA